MKKLFGWLGSLNLSWVLHWHFRPVYAWHFVSFSKRLAHDMPLTKARVGLVVRKWRPWKIKPCYYGFHASEKISHAIQYHRGPILCRVKLSGVIKRETEDVGLEKLVASRRKIVWMLDIREQLFGYRSYLTRHEAQQIEDAILKLVPESYR